MGIIEKVKTVLFNPKNGWKEFDNENVTHKQVFLNYLLPLSLIAVVFIFLGKGLIGSRFSVWGYIGHYGGIKYQILTGLNYSILWFLAINGGAYLAAVLIDAVFAGVFGVEKNFNKTFATVAYCFTPICLLTIVFAIPFMGWLYYMGSLYAVLLMFFAQQHKLANVEIPNGKKIGYTIVSMACLYAAFWSVYGILSVSIGAMFLRMMFF